MELEYHDEALYQQHESSESQTDSSHGSGTGKRSSANSPTPFIDYARASAGHIRQVVPMPPNRGTKRGGAADPFPCRLHRMLSCAESQGWENIVSWQTHGRSFRIHDWTALHQTIMPRFFGKSKVSTFRRQLYLYGFAGLKTGPDNGCFYHMLFLRHRPDLCPLMFRKSLAIRCPSSEPDLYALPMCPKLVSSHVFTKPASQQSEGTSVPVELSTFCTFNPSTAALIQPPQASARVLRCTDPSEHGMFKVLEATSIESDGDCRFNPTYIQGHYHKSLYEPIVSTKALPLYDQYKIKPIDDGLSMSSFFSEAVEDRKDKIIDDCGSSDWTFKAPGDLLGTFEDNCSKLASTTDNHMHIVRRMDLLFSQPDTALLEDPAPCIAGDPCFANTPHFPIAPDNNTHVKTSSVSMAPKKNTVLEYERAMAGQAFALQAPCHHDDIESNPQHPSMIETALLSLLEPEPMTEADLEACRRIALKKRL